MTAITAWPMTKKAPKEKMALASDLLVPESSRAVWNWQRSPTETARNKTIAGLANRNQWRREAYMIFSPLKGLKSAWLAAPAGAVAGPGPGTLEPGVAWVVEVIWGTGKG